MLEWKYSMNVFLQKKYFLLGIIGLFLVLFVWSLVLGGKDSSSSLPNTQTIVKEYDPERSGTMQHLDELVMKGISSIEEMKPFITDKDPKHRWVAVYVIGRVSDVSRVQILLPLLQDEDESVRISAAGTLANKGYKEALPVLISGLDSTYSITYLHPEREMADFSLEVLTFYTGLSFSSSSEWQKWWDETQEKLVWDETAKKYTGK